MAPEFGSPISHLPLIPESLLRKHHCHVPFDTRFRAAARLLAALWRRDRRLPLGYYVDKDGEQKKLGSRISDAAGLAGENFLNPCIAQVARRELAYREVGAMMDEARLLSNLLSSSGVTANLFAPWTLDLRVATCVLHEILPSFAGVATQILFEHSPSRGNPHFTADYTAFDVMIRYCGPEGQRGFVAIEVKYSESMREPLAEMRPRYNELSLVSDLYLDPAADALRANPLQQLWREHMLAQVMVDNDLCDQGYFVCIAPALNTQVQDAIVAYRGHLKDWTEGKVRFVDVWLESLIEAIRLNDPDHAQALYRRYCDFWLVDGEMELHAASMSRPRKKKRTTVATSTSDPSSRVATSKPRRKREAGVSAPDVAGDQRP